MPSWLTQISQFVVFLGISAIGFVFLIVSLVFGELFDHLDASVDHDWTGEGPAILSSRVLSVFVTAFGGFGAISTQYGLGTLAASGVGFLGGVCFAALIYAFASFLFRQQASSGIRTAELVGRPARVVVPIPEGGVGQVRCQVGEELMDKIARSRDGSAIADNTSVTIVQVLGDSVVVEKQ